MNRNRFAAGAFYIFCGLTVSCFTNNAPPSNSLIIGVSAPPTSLDPRFATDATSQRIVSLIFSSITTFSNELLPVPQLTDLIKQMSPTTLRFKLRNDLQFHDGRPATLEDLEFSISEYTKTTSPFHSSFKVIKKVVLHPENEIELQLSQYDSSFLYQLELLKLLPKHIYSKSPTTLAHPVGSGPYALERSDPSQVVLKKSLYKSHSEGRSDYLIFKAIRDENTRYLKAIKGDVDIFSNELPEDKVIQLRNHPRVIVTTTPGINFNYLVLNLKNPRLNNIEVRQALFSALNREDIVKFKLEDLAQVASSILAPINPFAGANLKFKKLNLDEIKGVIQKHRLSTVPIVLSSSSQAATNAQVIAQQWTKTGIKVELKSADWGTYYSDVRNGKYEIALMRWVGLIDPDVYRDTLASTEFPPGRNRGYYSNPKFDKIVEKARRTVDQNQRTQLYAQAQQIIADDLPIIPLWYNYNINVINKRVKDFEPIANGSFEPLIRAHP